MTDTNETQLTIAQNPNKIFKQEKKPHCNRVPKIGEHNVERNSVNRKRYNKTGCELLKTRIGGIFH